MTELIPCSLFSLVVILVMVSSIIYTIAAFHVLDEWMISKGFGTRKKITKEFLTKYFRYFKLLFNRTIR